MRYRYPDTVVPPYRASGACKRIKVQTISTNFAEVPNFRKDEFDRGVIYKQQEK